MRTVGLFRRSIRAARTAPVAATAPTSGTVGTGGIASAADLVAGIDVARAMSNPALSRARDLLASLVASLPIRPYGVVWNGDQVEELPLPPDPWMVRPDPNTTRAHTMSWTFHDLALHGVAVWHVTSRYASGFPASFEWLPWENVSIDAPLWAGNAPIGGITSVTFGGAPVPTADVVLFSSPLPGWLHTGRRAIRTAERLDQAAERFAVSEVPSGWLKQTGGEPMSGDELADLAADWQAARLSNAIGALNEYVEWHESSIDPSRLQLVEARQHQALEIARICNVPAYLLGAPTGGSMTYQNAQQAAEDAVRFGALPYIEVIEQTLSGDRITPRGRVVRLDRSGWVIGPMRADATDDTQTPAETSR